MRWGFSIPSVLPPGSLGESQEGQHREGAHRKDRGESADSVEGVDIPDNADLVGVGQLASVLATQ